jgi:hypothetical protein
LRNGIDDFNGIAREILSSPSEAVSSSSSLRRSTDTRTLVRNSSGDISKHIGDSRFTSEFGDSSGNDEAALIQFLGSEDHELLMTQIAEALEAEYFTDLNDSEMFLHESQEHQESCYWLQEEAQLDHDEIVICPVCRLVRDINRKINIQMHSYVRTAVILQHRISHLEIVGSFGDCVCGVAIDLRDKRTGEVMTAGGLKDKLADVYNRCVNDTHVQSAF